MVASDALMRLSLVISWPPGAKGTLKSTRIKTRLFFRSRSRTDSLGIRSSQKGLTLEFRRKCAELLWRSGSPSRRPCSASEPVYRVHRLRQAFLVGAEPLLVGTEPLAAHRWSCYRYS